ncbi:sigma-70 family RNA polymerase sigma factor [Candidatus Fermentibacteria bacterium]|nr:sigma-70 family RNA polymerase sigma factor [Candidatus Fermentibacteria bacterium]
MEFSGSSTEEVGTAARAGDGRALEELCRRLRVSFLVIAKRRVWDIDVAEDLTQDALSIVAERITEVSGDAEVVPWCLTVLRNIVGNYYSSRRRLERLGPLVGGFATRWHGGVDSDAEQARDEIRRMVPRLSSRCRQLVEWVLEGYTAEEMQQFLDLSSRNALYMRLYRCREELKVMRESERGMP